MPKYTSKYLSSDQYQVNFHRDIQLHVCNLTMINDTQCIPTLIVPPNNASYADNILACSYASQSPRQRQSAAFRHLHFFEQVGAALQPHLISSLQPTANISGTRPDWTPSGISHPQHSGLGAAAMGFRLSLQIQASTYVLKKCALSWRKLFHHLHSRVEHLLLTVVHLDM